MKRCSRSWVFKSLKKQEILLNGFSKKFPWSENTTCLSRCTIKAISFIFSRNIIPMTSVKNKLCIGFKATNPFLRICLKDIKAPVCKSLSTKTRISVLFVAAKSQNEWMVKNIHGTSTTCNAFITKHGSVFLQLTWEGFQECYEPKESGAEHRRAMWFRSSEANNTHRVCATYMGRWALRKGRMHRGVWRLWQANKRN